MNLEPKQRPYELLRQKRLMELYTWGKTSLPNEELFETIALHRTTNKAIESYGVTYQTALGYAKVVLFKLRKEAAPDKE